MENQNLLPIKLEGENQEQNQTTFLFTSPSSEALLYSFTPTSSASFPHSGVGYQGCGQCVSAPLCRSCLRVLFPPPLPQRTVLRELLLHGDPLYRVQPVGCSFWQENLPQSGLVSTGCSFLQGTHASTCCGLGTSTAAVWRPSMVLLMSCRTTCSSVVSPEAARDPCLGAWSSSSSSLCSQGCFSRFSPHSWAEFLTFLTQAFLKVLPFWMDLCGGSVGARHMSSIGHAWPLLRGHICSPPHHLDTCTQYSLTASLLQGACSITKASCRIGAALRALNCAPYPI